LCIAGGRTHHALDSSRILSDQSYISNTSTLHTSSDHHQQNASIRPMNIPLDDLRKWPIHTASRLDGCYLLHHRCYWHSCVVVVGEVSDASIAQHTVIDVKVLISTLGRQPAWDRWVMVLGARIDMARMIRSVASL